MFELGGFEVAVRGTLINNIFIPHDRKGGGVVVCSMMYPSRSEESSDRK